MIIFMGLFNKKEKKIKFSDTPTSFNNYDEITGEDLANTEAIQIMQNDGVNICAEACACCWDTKIPNGYEDRAVYIGKRTKTGHTSVIEHSNHVFFLIVHDNDAEDLMTFLSNCRFVHTKYKHSKKYPVGYLIIGGSWRAYSDIIKMMSTEEMADNIVIRKLITSMFSYMNSCGFLDIINENVIANEFSNYLFDPKSPYRKVDHYSVNDKIEIINADDINFMIEQLKEACPEPELFSIFDLLDMCTITVLFKNMSRIITQQLTRHRNAITQESQRYVNYSKGGFNSPALFKAKYDPKYKYSIQFGKSSQKMTLQEIGEAINSIYGQLIDEVRTDKHNLQYEDARGYLANNTQCGKIYITFTYRNFFQFLYLREDLHAQVEIRQFAKTLGEWFRTLYPEYNDLYEALKPRSINTSHYCDGLTTEHNVDEVDEILSKEEITEKLEEQIANQEIAENSEPTEYQKVIYYV